MTCRDLQEELKAAQLLPGDGAAASEERENPTVRSMYCKELLTQGQEEFCFEELRAQRYALAQRQEVDGNPLDILSIPYYRLVEVLMEPVDPKPFFMSHLIVNIVICAIVSLLLK